MAIEFTSAGVPLCCAGATKPGVSVHRFRQAT